MPAYVSHTIMAREVYNKLNDKNVSLDYMITFSLGGDLCKYAKCRKDSHRIKQDEFLYNMCDYMKEHNLTKDPECLGVLYGHICHYLMDKIIHPLVYKVTRECTPNKNNHTLIELYYDNYLSKKKHNVTLNKHDNRVLFKAKMNNKVSKMIDNVYSKTYSCDHVSRYYKFNLSLYKKIKYAYSMFSINLLKNVTGYTKFNNKNKIETDTLDELYDKSVNEAIKYIKEVNKCLNK